MCSHGGPAAVESIRPGVSAGIGCSKNGLFAPARGAKVAMIDPRDIAEVEAIALSAARQQELDAVDG